MLFFLLLSFLLENSDQLPFWEAIPSNTTATNTTDFWYWSELSSSSLWLPRYYHTMNSFQGNLWIFGGDSTFRGNLNDVYISSDGAGWSLLESNAPWRVRSCHTSVSTHNDSLLLLTAGTDGVNVLNDVWIWDGLGWNPTTSQAEWAARQGHASLYFQDSFWIFGGSSSAGTMIPSYNDVWKTSLSSIISSLTVGYQPWTLSTISAPFSKRFGHSASVYNNAMWVMGGSTSTTCFNDVWYSTNGTNWILATSNAQWPARTFQLSETLDNHMWVFGGIPDTSTGNFFNDVWYSTNGVVWVLVTSETRWVSRMGQKSAIFQNEIVVSGGTRYDGSFLNDVWSSQVPQLDAPAMEPNGGTYSYGVTIELLSDPGATIFYTTDGSIPSVNSLNYSAPIEQYSLGDFEIRAFAVREGWRDSDVSSATFHVSNFAINPWRITALVFGTMVSVAFLAAIARISYVLFLKHNSKMKGRPLLMGRIPGGDGSTLGTTGTTRTSETMTSTMELWHIDPAEIKLLTVVGVGSFCKVWRASWRGMEVAVKEHLLAGSSFLTEEDIQTFVQEARMLSTLRHPHVLQFYGASITGSEMLILTEFCALLSLRQVLSDKKYTFNFDRALTCAREIALGMNYLHTRLNPIVHRDLKSPNVLLTETWIAKVADFGVARIVDDRGMMTQGVGSALWSAPEVLQKSKYSVAADVYAFGVVMWELITRHEPYEGMSGSQVAIAVASGERPNLQLVPEDTPKRFSDLMIECWSAKPALRPNFVQVLAQLDET